MATSEFTLRFTRQDGKIDMFRWKFASFFKNPGVPLSALMLHEMLPPCRSRDSIWLEFHAGLDHYADRQEGGAWVCDWTACRKTTSHTEYNQHTHTHHRICLSPHFYWMVFQKVMRSLCIMLFMYVYVYVYIYVYTHMYRSHWSFLFLVLGSRLSQFDLATCSLIWAPSDPKNIAHIYLSKIHFFNTYIYIYLHTYIYIYIIM